jgi:phage gp46-like protein
MTDIALSWSNEIWRGDWSLAADGTLVSDNDLETAVLLSIFTDRTALPDDDIPDKGTIRGWWADTYRRYPLGSRLWLLWREKQTETTRRRAEEYTRESLQWMIDAGVARTVGVRCTWIAMGFLEMLIDITPPGGDRRTWRYPLPWAQMAGTRA